MFPAVKFILTILAVAATHVRADPNPNSPAPGDVFIQGKPCTISWSVDPTGVWRNMNIDLMTGDNYAMVFLASVAKGIDATNPTKNTFSYTCPQVTPHSTIYFYQFTSPSTANKTWTGRFAITDSANDIVAPTQSTQSNGEAIPWGTGSLVNASSSARASGVTTTVSTNDTTSTSSTPSVSQGLATSDTPTPSLASGTTISPLASTSTLPAGANGAVAALSVSRVFLQTGLILGLAALGFSVML